MVAAPSRARGSPEPPTRVACRATACVPLGLHASLIAGTGGSPSGTHASLSVDRQPALGAWRLVPSAKKARPESMLTLLPAVTEELYSRASTWRPMSSHGAQTPGACGYGPLLGSVGASGFTPGIAGTAGGALLGRRDEVLGVRANSRTNTRTFLPRFGPPEGVKPYVLLVRVGISLESSVYKLLGKFPGSLSLARYPFLLFASAGS